MSVWQPEPTKIIGIGTNYRQHAAEMGRPIPPVPKVFFKPPSALIGDGESIILPASSDCVHHEAELGVVIGRRCRNVSPGDAAEVIAGFCCVNDVTARDHQRADGVFARAKGFDTFCPAGPGLVTGLDVRDLNVQCWVNGTLRQDGRTSDLIFDVPTLVAFVSSIMTLEPGDLICTGTPSGVDVLLPGDQVEVRIEGIGRLCNGVVQGV
jgi:2-keto-4-pentenoate hydratase/2-oxohepta-3-ene-1,7-dioic acid hydratase in catechol pathway